MRIEFVVVEAAGGGPVGLEPFYQGGESKTSMVTKVIFFFFIKINYMYHRNNHTSA